MKRIVVAVVSKTAIAVDVSETLWPYPRLGYNTTLLILLEAVSVCLGS